jgi:hypothetical protein
MTFAASIDFVIQRQRGFWLRCFLSVAILLLFESSIVPAQVDIPKPERLTHVEGVVVDPDGRPVPDIEVALVKPDTLTLTLRSRTNQSGLFNFDKVKGDYIFQVARTKYAPAERAIFVTDEIVTHLERKKLYVVLGPGACQDACSAVLTSKKDFDKVLRRNGRAH